MCIRCEIDDAVSDCDWESLITIAMDLRDGRRSLDPHEEVAEGDLPWTDEAWSFTPTSFGFQPKFDREFLDHWSVANPEPHHPIAEWVARHLHVTLSPWQRRLLGKDQK